MGLTGNGVEHDGSFRMHAVQSPIPGLGSFSQMVLDTVDFTHKRRNLPILLVTTRLTRCVQIPRQLRPIQAH